MFVMASLESVGEALPNGSKDGTTCFDSYEDTSYDDDSETYAKRRK